MNKILYLLFAPILIFCLSACNHSKQNEIEFRKEDNNIHFLNKYNKILYSLDKGTVSIIDRVKSDTIVRNGIAILNNNIKTSDLKINDYYFEEFQDSLGTGKKLVIVFDYNSLIIYHSIGLYENFEHIVFWVDLLNNSEQDFRIHYLSAFHADIVLSGDENMQHFFLDGNSGKIPTKVRDTDSLNCRNNILITEKNDNFLSSFVAGGYTYKEFDRFTKAKKKESSYKVNVYNEDPVGKLILSDQSYSCKDKLYINFHQANPLLALERYSEIFKIANSLKIQIYDFPTVCLWYNDFYGDTSMGNHSHGAVLEMKQAKKSGFPDYSRVAIRLVPDMYALINQQGWWDDEHWQLKNIFTHRGRSNESGYYKAPYLTTSSWAKEIDSLGGLAFTYIQPGKRNDSYAESFPEHMLFNEPHAPILDSNGDTVYHSETQWQDYLRGVMIKDTYDYTDSGFISHLQEVYHHLDTSGIEGLMYDFPDMARANAGGMDDIFSTTAGAYRKVFEIGRSGLGEDAYLHERNIKVGSDITLGVVSSHRIMGDNDKINPTLTRRGGLRWYKNRVLVNYDMDAKNLFVTSPDNRDGQRAMLTMTYVTSGRFLMANSFASIQKDSVLFYDFTRVFPFHNMHKSARPVDAFTGKLVPEVFDFVVDSSWHQLTFYNTRLDSGSWPEWGQTFHLPDKGQQVQAEISVELSGEPGFGGIGLDPDKSYYFYDFWNNSFLGSLKGEQTLSQLLRPGEARMISVHEVSPHPQFISTNRHIMQGLVDMPGKPRWDHSTHTLSGVSMVVKGEPYEIVLANNGYLPVMKKYNQSHAEIETKKMNSDLSVVVINSQKTQAIEWEATFKKNNPE